jgi:hypothetical protein
MTLKKLSNLPQGLKPSSITGSLGTVEDARIEYPFAKTGRKGVGQPFIPGAKTRISTAATSLPGAPDPGAPEFLHLFGPKTDGDTNESCALLKSSN